MRQLGLNERCQHVPPRAAGGAGSSPASAASAPSAIAAPSGASTAGGGPTKNPATDGQTINVLMVNNPQMIDLQSLTAENFTAETGITVNYTVLPENDMRDKVSLEFKNQAGQYDVATLSNFEIPIYARNDWLTPLSDFATNDPAFDQADIFPSMTASLSADGTLYGEPFYGESSFLMYRKDIFDAKGLTMPQQPDLGRGRRPGRQGRQCTARHEGDLPARAARLGSDGRPADHRGEHLRRDLVRRGLECPGQRPGFKDATNFYIDLVKAAR